MATSKLNPAYLIGAAVGALVAAAIINAKLARKAERANPPMGRFCFLSARDWIARLFRQSIQADASFSRNHQFFVRIAGAQPLACEAPEADAGGGDVWKKAHHRRARDAS